MKKKSPKKNFKNKKGSEDTIRDMEKMMKEKIHKAILKARSDLAKSGYLVSECVDSLKEIFDLSTDSLFLQSQDAGSYIKIQVDFIEESALEAVKKFYSPSKKKEIWLRRFKEKSKTDPGRFYVYQFSGKKRVMQSGELLLKEVLKKKLST